MPLPALTRADADALIRRFDGLKPKAGGGWTAKCPAHEDRQASLSIDIKNGKILVRCFAGCDAAVIAAGKGLTLADLFLDASATPSRVPPTVDSLAAAKGLPVELLRRYGVRNVADLSSAERFQHGIKASEGVWIPYYNPDGTLAARTRIRSAHIAKDGSTWAGSFGAPLPYGLHDLADAATQGIVVVCEGETDYWSLRAMGVPAIGLPGATTVGGLTRGYFPDGLTALYVAQDSDQAGAGFAAKVSELAASWGLPCYPVLMPAGCKDVNDVYRRDPATAADRFMALLAAAAAKVTATREFSTAGEIYRLTLPEWGLALELDQVARKWGDLVGELAILRDAGPDVFRGNVNLSNVERRQGVALQIAKRAQGLGEIDWPTLMEDFAVRCLRAQKLAGAVVDLRTVALPQQEQTWEIDAFKLSRRDATCLFGDGGTGKSLIAVYLAGVLARQGVKVLYLDAEWEACIHKERLVSLFGSEIPPLLYLEHRRPLELTLDQVRRRVLEHEIEYIVLDSVGLLTVGAPEESGAALGFSRAVQQMGIGSLTLAHIRKPQGTGDIRPQDQKPFGSVFYHNLFRRTYFVKAEPDASEGAKQVVVWNPKWNHRGAGQRPFGLAFQDDGTRTMIRQVEATTVQGLADKLPNSQRLKAALRRGPQTAAALADELGAKVETLDRELRRGAGKWCERAPMSDGVAGWALIASPND